MYIYNLNNSLILILSIYITTITIILFYTIPKVLLTK